MMTNNTTKMMTNNTTNNRQFPAAFGGRGRMRGGAPPPAYRAYPPKKEVPVEKKIDINSEMNFPSLGKNDSTWSASDSKPATAGAGKSSFASLASNWKEADDAEQDRIAYEKEQAAREAEEYKRYSAIRRLAANSSHVTSSRLYRYDDDCESEEEYEDIPHTVPTSTDDEWRTVDRSAKTRRYGDEGLDDDYDY